MELSEFASYAAPEECNVCEGVGGWDASKDCEVYDQWIDCPVCGGTGEAEE